MYPTSMNYNMLKETHHLNGQFVKACNLHSFLHTLGKNLKPLELNWVIRRLQNFFIGTSALCIGLLPIKTLCVAASRKNSVDDI